MVSCSLDVDLVSDQTQIQGYLSFQPMTNNWLKTKAMVCTIFWNGAHKVSGFFFFFFLFLYLKKNNNLWNGGRGFYYLLYYFIFLMR